MELSEHVQYILHSAKTIVYARDYNKVEPKHIMLSLFLDENDLPKIILEKVGLDNPRMIRDYNAGIPKQGHRGVQRSQDPPLAQSTIDLLEAAEKEALSYGDTIVSIEHLFLALFKNPSSEMEYVFKQYSIKPKELYVKMKDVIAGMTTVDIVDGKAVETQSEGIGMQENAKNSSKDKEEENPLEKYTTDLTAIAAESKLDPVIGRDDEIRRVIQILNRRSKNNPVVVGEPGVGKTAVIEGLAQRIIKGDVPESLKNDKILSLDLGALLAGASYRGEFEERLKKIMDEIRQAGNIILVIDEMHTLIGAGAAEGAIDAANILKPALSRGEIQVIGATTLDEYRKYVEKDSALERRFQSVIIEEPTVDESIEIIKGLKPKYEDHHKLLISDEAIVAAVKLSSKYITDRFLPDKAIDVIDEASSKVRLKVSTLSPEGKELEKDLRELIKEKEEAIRNQEFEKASQLRDDEADLKDRIREMAQKYREEHEANKPTVTAENVAEVIATMTGVPVTKLTEGESERLLKLEETLHARVIGQNDAVVAISKAIRRARVGLKSPNRPIGSFIFCGPTGVGKTELAKALAEAVFGSEDNMIRVDMSEFMEKHSTAKLIGSPPGYVGYDDGGHLTELIRKKPYSVVLFDEIEKAHPDVFNIMLQILDDGRLTDSKGRHINFKNTIIIMTSNVGASMITTTSKLGFSTSDDESKDKYEKLKETVTEEMKKAFRPEFLNRIDETIVFAHLKQEEIREIVDLMLKDLFKRLAERELSVEVTDEVKDHLAKNGYSEAYGARPLRRLIQRKIEDNLAEEILSGKYSQGDTIRITLVDDKITFEKAPKKKAKAKEEVVAE